MITACLLHWKRTEALGTLLEAVMSNDLISEIIVWNNNPEVELSGKLDKVKTINSDQNVITYGRYLAAEMASNDLIYTQDDDWYPADLDFLMSHHKENEVTAVVPKTHINKINRNKFVGWGSLFNKSCLSVFEGYLDKYPKDLLLYREADLLFTNINSYTSHLSTPKSLVAEDKRSLHWQENHYQYHQEMLSRVEELKS